MMSLVCSDFALAVFQVVVRTWFSVVMLKRVLLVAGSGVINARDGHGKYDDSQSVRAFLHRLAVFWLAGWPKGARIYPS
jgi:hypothetical protein